MHPDDINTEAGLYVQSSVGDTRYQEERMGVKHLLCQHSLCNKVTYMRADAGGGESTQNRPMPEVLQRSRAAWTLICSSGGRPAQNQATNYKLADEGGGLHCAHSPVCLPAEKKHPQQTEE